MVGVVERRSELIVQLLANPDSIVVLDYTLFDFDSVDDLLTLQQRFSKVNWILFSDELSDDFIRS